MKLNVSMLNESDYIEIDQWVWWTFQDETGYAAIPKPKKEIQSRARISVTPG